MVGEIARGTLADHTLTFDLLRHLPTAVVAETDEVLGYIERLRLHRKGISYVDVHLLASAALSGTKLWTRDRRLLAVARQLGFALAEPARMEVIPVQLPFLEGVNVFCNSLIYWSGREDLNLRPPAPHAGTLPGCATPRMVAL